LVGGQGELLVKKSGKQLQLGGHFIDRKLFKVVPDPMTAKEHTKAAVGTRSIVPPRCRVFYPFNQGFHAIFWSVSTCLTSLVAGRNVRLLPDKLLEQPGTQIPSAWQSGSSRGA